MSKSILSFFTKKWPWANRSQISFKKSDVSDSLVIRVNRSQKTSNLLQKKTYFSYDFDSYSPFLCQKSKSLPSLFAQSLFFKDWWDRFAYGHSFVKNDGSDSRANRSLDHKKRAIRSKNRWSNSQPCRVLNQNLDKNWTGKILHKIILTSKIPIKVVNFLWTIEKFSDSAKESVTKAAKSFTSLKGQYCL